MAADTTYNVKVRYDVDSGGAERAAESLARSFQRISHLIGEAFAVHKILDFTKRIVDLQAEAENLQLSLATMLTGFGAPGFTKGVQDFQRAMMASGMVIQQIRMDAAKLPGTAEDLMMIMQAAMPGGIASGHAVMGEGSILEMSKRLLAAGNLLNLPGGAATAAREFQAMMEGRAMTRNDLFARTRGLMNDGKGISAKEFNALSEPKRWETIEKALAKIVDPALPTFANQWRAISTTTINWAQQLARLATAGPMHVLEDRAKALNNWFRDNRQQIEETAKVVSEKLGHTLAEAFDRIREALQFIVSHRDAIVDIGKALAVLFTGGKLASLLGGGGLGGALNGGGGLNAFGGKMVTGALLGHTLNGMSGGSGLTDVIMSVGGALVSFGGTVGIAAAGLVGFTALLNKAADALDKSHKSDINREDETKRIVGLSRHFTRSGEYSKDEFEIARSLINTNKLTGDMGMIDDAKFKAFIASHTMIQEGQSHSAFPEVLKFFQAVAQDMRDHTALGPELPNEQEKLLAQLYEKNKKRMQEATAGKGKVNVTVNIKQDISQAEDPDRILVKTKQALEDALIRPIESGNNRFAILR